MPPDSYLDRIERGLSAGVLHTFLLLEVDRLGPIHGYALIKALRDDAGDEDAFKAGTIYPILNELETLGVVRGRWGQGGSGPRRKYYELTADGQRTLQQAFAHWTEVRALIDSVSEKRKGSKP